MDNKSSWSCTFELEDIEIIDHKKENEEKSEKWSCNQCSLFFLEKGKLDEHKKKHSAQEIVKCKYCNKALSKSDGNSECYENRKCETCEYKCSKCPQRFLRHSSLINHEKKHSSPKKKRAVSCNKKVNGIGPENVAVSKGIKRKWQETDDLEEQPTKGLKTKRSLNMKNSPKKKINVMVKTQGDSLGGGERSPIKTTKRLSLKASKSAEEKNNCENAPVKVTKRLSLKTKSILEDQNSVGFEHKQNAPTSNLLAVSQTSNMSSNENVVNYKPFSCHVCGDTFASDSALLNHIRTHGESAAKCFKCKFCNDEFDDIYKMQYHLAICPLAEDELEYSLSQSVPTVLPIKYSGGTLSPRKRGRPKKSVESTLTREKNEDEWTSSSSKKRNFRKRKSEMLENNLTAGNFTTSSLPKKPKRIPNKESLGGPDNNRVSEENRSEPLAGDIPELTRENEPDDDRKKLHQCPFPRCDFKFTREKALLCHMRNHSDDFDDSLKCHKCDIPFDDIQTLRLHIDTCKGIKEERDDDFNEEFETEGHDSSPLRTFQRMRKDFVCSRCGKSYQSQEKRNRHLESCGSKFVCRICKDDFLNQPLLDEHFASNHPPYTAYHCYLCEEDFISELFLQIHQTDEHRDDLITEPMQDNIREKVQTFPPSSEVIHEMDSAFVTLPDSRSTGSRCVNRIPYRSVAVTMSRYANKIRSSPVNVTTGRYGNRISRFIWCPICLKSFDERGNLRVHFRERHVVENNSLYSCEICDIKLPFAEMMCYHLELHSSNLLSVNRFSKLIAYVKQCRIVDDFRSSEAEIECGEKTFSQMKKTIGSDFLKANNENSTKMVCTQSRKVTNKSQPKTIPDANQFFPKSSGKIGRGLLQKHNFASRSKRRSKNVPNKVTDDKTQDLIKPVSKIKSSIEINSETEPKERMQNKINLENPTRSLRSRTLRNCSFLNQDEKRYGNKNIKLRKVSVEETCIETKSLIEKTNNIEMDDSKVLESTNGKQPFQVVNSVIKQEIVNRRRGHKRRPLRLRTMKRNKTLEIETDSKPKNQLNTKNAVDPENYTKSYPLSINEEKSTSTATEETKVTLSQTRDRQKINKGDIPTKRTMEDSSAAVESEPNSGLVNEENTNNPESRETTEMSSINLNKSKEEDLISNLIVNRKSVDGSINVNIELEKRNTNMVTEHVEQHHSDLTGETCSEVTQDSIEVDTNKFVERNIDLNDELGERSTHSVTKYIEQNNPDLTGETFNEVTQDSIEVDTNRNVQSEDSVAADSVAEDSVVEDSVDSQVSGTVPEQLTEEESKNSLSGSQEKLQEESRSSTSSNIDESDEICCTMCTQSFYNQDELLDHLATHI